MTDDLRWFASNSLTRLVISGLERRGLKIALEGNAPARAAVCLSAQLVEPAWKYARKHGIPLAFYLWDIPPWRLDGGHPDPVIDLAGRLLVVPRPWGRFAERPNYYSRLIFLLKHAREVWVPSRNTEGDASRLVDIAPHHLPYCYDSARFVPGDVQRDPRTVLAISRLVPSKGHDLLLQAAKLIDPMPRVRIIGRGTQADELRRMSITLGVPGSIETDVDDAGVLDAYRRATVVVCPSRFEGFGLTGIEGLACGATVVASDIPPHREFLGSHASYSPVGDVASLAAAITQALEASPRPAPDLTWLGIDAATARFATAIDRLLAA